MEDLRKRLDFLRLDEQDSERLRAAKPTFDSIANEFVETFYDHLLAAAESLASKSSMARRRARLAFFVGLLSAASALA